MRDTGGGQGSLMKSEESQWVAGRTSVTALRLWKKAIWPQSLALLCSGEGTHPPLSARVSCLSEKEKEKAMVALPREVNIGKIQHGAHSTVERCIHEMLSIQFTLAKFISLPFSFSSSFFFCFSLGTASPQREMPWRQHHTQGLPWLGSVGWS